MSLLGKRIFTLPPIFTFKNGIKVSETKLFQLSKLVQIIVENLNGKK